MEAVTLENLQVIIEAQTKGLKEEMNRVKKEVKGMTDVVNKETSKVRDVFKNLFKGAIFAYGLTKMAQLAKESTKMAMQVEGAIQQIKRTMGESSQMFLKWAKDNGLAFNLAQADVIKFGAIYSNLLSGFSGGTKQTMQYTQELLKASSIIASGTGRTMEDVMERIRSGLLGNTEAIEDLGINVNVAMLQSTEAFKRFANGQEWNDLSFQTQQQIRLFAILEQTSSKFGNEVMNNTNSSMQQLVAVLKDVWLNLGNAFLPILNVVLPILTNFAMALRTVTGYIAAFMQTLFGKSKKAVEGPKIATNTMNKAKSAALGGANAQNGYNKALDKTGETAKKTAKEVNRLLGGFDEINSISDSGSKGGGLPKVDKTPLPASPLPEIGGINPIDWGVDEEPDISGVVSAAEKVKAIFKSIVDFIKENKEVIISVIAGLVATVLSYFAITNWASIMTTIGTVVGYIKLIPTALGVAFLNLTSPAALVAMGIGLVVGAIVYLWQTSESFRNSVMTIINGIMDILKRLWNEILSPLFSFLADVFVTILKPIAEFIGTVVCDVVEAVFKVLESLWINILEPIANFLIDIFAEALKGVIEIWEAWKPVIDLIFDGLKWLWDNMLKPFVNFIADRLIKTFERWGTSVRETIGIVKNIFSGLIDFIVGVFTGDWSRAWEGVKKIFGSIFEGIGKLAKRPINGIINIVNTLIRGLNKIHLPDWVPVIGGKGINLPEIPKLAKGGIVDSATLAVVGEAGKEAVMPLENNTGWITQLAEKVASRMPQSSTSSDRPIILKFDFNVGTLKFAKTICTSLNKLGESNGGVIPINL
ncbi:phage tail tape measure protein [Clostridium perfringens A]|uniref:phage tail protein n=1 Tax=Clostridium perfringens TaxID=1502 RepID=UPI00399CF832